MFFFFPILEKLCLKEHLVGFTVSFNFKRVPYENIQFTYFKFNSMNQTFIQGVLFGPKESQPQSRLVNTSSAVAQETVLQVALRMGSQSLSARGDSICKRGKRSTCLQAVLQIFACPKVPFGFKIIVS